MTRPFNNDGSPRKQRVPKMPQKPSMATRLAFLKVGESDYFLVKMSLQMTLNAIQSLLVRSEYLEGMKFITRRWLLVREGEPVRMMAQVTRIS